MGNRGGARKARMSKGFSGRRAEGPPLLRALRALRAEVIGASLRGDPLGVSARPPTTAARSRPAFARPAPRAKPGALACSMRCRHDDPATYDWTQMSNRPCPGILTITGPDNITRPTWRKAGKLPTTSRPGPSAARGSSGRTATNSRRRRGLQLRTLAHPATGSSNLGLFAR